MTQPSQSGQAGGEGFNLANGIIGLEVRFKTLDPNHAAIIGEYWYRYGYAVREFLTPPNDLKCMTLFTYWKMSETYLIVANADEGVKDVIRGILERALRYGQALTILVGWTWRTTARFPACSTRRRPMPKPLKMEDFIELPDVDEMQFGRNYIRELYTPGEGYDIVQFQFWRDYLRSIAMSAFEWEHVPAGIDVRAMEYIALMFGQGAMFTDEGGHLFAQAAPSNMINMYYNPNEIRLVAPNGQTWTRHCEAWVLTPDNGGEPIIMDRDAVMLFDNMLRMPLDKYIRNYARRLATIDRIIDVNVGAQRTPWTMIGPEESRGTRKAIIKSCSPTTSTFHSMIRTSTRCRACLSCKPKPPTSRGTSWTPKRPSSTRR